VRSSADNRLPRLCRTCVAQLAREIATVITGKGPDDLVFTVPNGSPLRLANWRKTVFLPTCDGAAISNRFRIHDLRHTAAALMVQAGSPPKMLQEIMGHASITTTPDLYGHLYPGNMDRYADRLDDAAEDAGTARIRPDDDEDSDG
jgi:integrase